MGLSAAPAADEGGQVPRQFARVQPAPGNRAVGDHDDADGPIVEAREERAHRGAGKALAQRVPHGAKGVHIGTVHAARGHGDTARVHGPADQVVGPVPRRGAAQFPDVPFQFADARVQFAGPLHQVHRLAPEGLRGPADERFVPLDGFVGAGAGHGLYAPHAGGDARFADHPEQPGLSRGAEVGAAAQFQAHAADAHHAYPVLVLLGKKRHGALAPGVFEVGFERLDGDVLPDELVDPAFDGVQFIGRDGVEMGEIETQAVRVDHGAPLFHVGAEGFPQHGVEKVGRRVVARDGLPARSVDVRGDEHPGFQTGRAVRAAMMDEDVAVPRCVLDGDPVSVLRLQPAGVAHLSARFGVEGGFREDDGAALDQDYFGPIDCERAVSEETGRVFNRHVGRDGWRAALRSRRNGPFPLLRHLRLEAGHVHGHVPFLGHQLRQVHGEPVGVVQFEGLAAPDLAASFGLRPVHDPLEKLQPMVERTAEGVFFGPDHRLHFLASGPELRVGLTHLPDKRRHQPVEEGVGEPERAAIPGRAAQDPAQDVAAAFVGGQGAVGDGEGKGADMVGHDAEGHGRIPFRAGLFRQFSDVVHQRLEHVDLVIRIHALQDGQHALEPHPRVDMTGGQGGQLAVGSPVVLYEDQVPDLHEPLAVPVDPADVIRVVFQITMFRPPVIVDFGVGSARAGLAHFPEIVLLAESQDAAVRHARVPLPELLGFVILPVNRRPEPVGGKFPFAGQQFPGPGDGFFLVVVPERPVPQHLEEGLVDGRPAHVLQVVVLAAGPDALLEIHRPRVVPGAPSQEDILELVHPRVGEQQGRIVPGHHAGARHDGVAATLEEPRKRSAQFGSGQFPDSSISSSTRWTTWYMTAWPNPRLPRNATMRRWAASRSSRA